MKMKWIRHKDLQPKIDQLVLVKDGTNITIAIYGKDITHKDRKYYSYYQLKDSGSRDYYRFWEINNDSYGYEIISWMPLEELIKMPEKDFSEYRATNEVD